MHKSFYALVALTCSTIGLGQQLSHPVMASRDDLFATPRPHLAVPDTVDVLAVMVQFQVDNDVGTSGNGQFDLSPATDPIIDSPPHSGAYFTDHLTFLENYYYKASDGSQIVRATLVDTIYTLPNPMAAYSPQRNESNEKVAMLARDTWELVDSSNKVADFSSYDCFVIFHAGAGHDIDLVSTLGYDPTPRDIPSLYLGSKAFDEAFGPGYPGILVNNGTDTVRNSAILPETENRLLPGISGDVLLELSFNGLLSASIGSFLGLPDLFDTKTGHSAIGRFGLMDGQAIFSFAGLFPPEPSAWEKYWLGWITPIDVQPGEHLIDLPAVGFVPTDSIYRLPISAGEYFLLENRQRDPEKNGQTVTSIYDGVTTVQTFVQDTIGFNAFDVSSLSGVVVDVSDLDWSLPGGVDEQGTILYGGILVWHIDEGIIQQNIGTNAVNADPAHRGVDVEEADGSQDIGQSYGFLSPGSGSEEGTPLDFWYEGNLSPVYRNEFSFSTHPSSTSNGGANSHITVNDFSLPGARMSANMILGDQQISLLPGFPKSTKEFLPDPSLTIGSLAAGAPNSIVATTTGRGIPVNGLEGSSVSLGTSGKVFGWNGQGMSAVASSHADGHFIEATNSQGLASLETSAAIKDLNGDSVPEIILAQGKTSSGVGGGSAVIATLRALTPIDTNGDSLAESYFSLDVYRKITTPPVVSDSVIAFGGTGGTAYFLRFDGSLIDSTNFLASEADSIVGISLSPVAHSFVLTGSDGTVIQTSRTASAGASGTDVKINVGAPIAGPAVAEITGTTSRIAFATTDGRLYLTDDQLNPLPGFPVNTGGTCPAPPALADLNGDGQRDIMLFSGNKIFAYNAIGVSLDYFPVTVGSSDSLASNPIVADVDGDGDADVIAVSKSGLVVAYDAGGHLAPGFPLQAGIGAQSAAVIDIPTGSLSSIDVGLVVASSGDGSISAWKTAAVPVNPQNPHPWAQYQKDAQHTGLASETITGSQLISEFFPASRVYNWPNPVYNGTTYIRFFVKEDASVHIKVFDLAGDLVAELSGQGIGGLDNEIAWNVSDVESGIYFARVEAAGISGSGSAIIKVAVVK